VSDGLTYLPDEGSMKSKLATVGISRKYVSLLAGDTVEDRLKRFREKCYRLHIEMFQVLMPYTVWVWELVKLETSAEFRNWVTCGSKRLISHIFFDHLNHCRFRQCFPPVTWPEDC
jgi:hypothetical protein